MLLTVSKMELVTIDQPEACTMSLIELPGNVDFYIPITNQTRDVDLRGKNHSDKL